MCEHGIFVEYICDQAGNAFDQRLFLFAGYVFARQFDFYVWHKESVVPGLLCNSFGGDVYVEVKVIVDQGISKVLKEVTGTELDVKFGPVNHYLTGGS